MLLQQPGENTTAIQKEHSSYQLRQLVPLLHGMTSFFLRFLSSSIRI